MCGIIGIIKKDNTIASKMCIKRYEKQKTRGQEGFGYLAINEKCKIVNEARSQGEKDILKYLENEKTPCIMFHHRMPTSTPNFIEATHPIKVDNPKLQNVYYVLHNGIIHNIRKLKAKHNKEGFEYTTEIRKEWITKHSTYFETIFNDSECLAIELAKYLDGKAEKIEAEGSIAFIAIEADRNNKVLRYHYGRNTSPLVVDNNKQFISITSEGEGKSIDSDILYTIEADSLITSEKAINWEKTKLTAGYLQSGYGQSLWDDDENDIEKDYLRADMKETQKLLNKAIEKGDELATQSLQDDLLEIEMRLSELEKFQWTI